MKVLGYTVSPEIEAACLARMRKGWFTAAQLADVVWGAPKISYDTSYYVADRLIQRERKAGNIRRRGRGWIWQTIADSEDICGFCGLLGADKFPHPVRWPGEEGAGTELVHAECEQTECERAHSLLTDEQRRQFLKWC